MPNISMVTRKEGEEVKHEKIPKTFLFEHILKKSTHQILVLGHFSWSTFGLHLVMGPKAIKLHFCESRAMDRSMTMKCDHGKMLSNMGQPHGP